ncbi:HAD family hydrolase [Kribbella sp. NPDC050820]|uniref:HAD family hydrolase n=1 Tax=Kribbella sp. NPDC050820 TaxID=3155408 RepID=UPI003402B2B5
MTVTERNLQVAVLDMAGTTIDERGSVRVAVESAVRQVTGGRLPDNFDDTFHSARGGAKTAMFEALLGDVYAARVAHAIFETELIRLIGEDRVQVLPGATETINVLRSSGVKVALTTGFSARVRQVLLTQLGWTEMVDLILSPEDVGRGRPYPDTVLTAILRLRAPSVQSVAVVGDTLNDLYCGTRAGASIVAGVLTGAHDKATLETAPHTHLINSIADLPAIIDSWERP